MFAKFENAVELVMVNQESSIIQTLSTLDHSKLIFKSTILMVLKKKIVKGFYHIWTWWSSWSCDLDNLYKLSFSLPMEAADLPSISSGKNIFESNDYTYIIWHRGRGRNLC